MKIEIGAGEHPHPSFDVHTDILPLPGISHVCPMNLLPFPDATFDELRANDVLEHQSWELVPGTLAEWKRVLKPGAAAYIQVPNAEYIIKQWMAGVLSTRDLNYWLLGGHSDRAAHQGTDSCGHPRWIWNAHHTAFTEAYLCDMLHDAGFTAVDIASDGGSNLMCWCRKGE